jgi:hypothetical protein
MYGRLTRPEALWLSELGIEAANNLDPYIVNNWTLQQQLAATLSLLRKTEEANKLIHMDKDLQQVLKSESGCQPEGWAWRSLAQYRLGNETASIQDMHNAEICGIADRPQSRTWNEWNTIILSYVLANKWKSAFKASTVPRNQRTRLLTQARLVKFWILRRDVQKNK